MTTKHTPGPWKIDVETESYFCSKTGIKKWDYTSTWVKAGASSIAVLCRDDKENARLIAAAPELLEAVKIFYEYAGRVCPSQVDKLSALIAKVEGRDL